MHLIFFLLLASFCKPVDKPVAPVSISILYFSPIDKELQHELRRAITATYNCNVSIWKEIQTLPANAYHKPRNRYKAGLVIDYLKSISTMDKIIGITNKDISTKKGAIEDWGIMGLGFCPGKSCVISTFRIKTANEDLFRERFVKVALHELGHTFGLPHCTKSATCFMADADGTVKSVDRETRQLCSHCKSLIPQYIKQ